MQQSSTPLGELENALSFARERVAAGSLNEGLGLLWRLALRHPGSSLPFQHAANALREAGAVAEADRLLDEAAGRFPQDLGILISRAWTAHRRGETEEALTLWQAVRARAPDHPAGYSGAAQTLREATRFEEAEALLREGMGRVPQEAALWLEFAWIAQRRHDWFEALQRWKAAQERFPNHPTGFVQAGVVLRELHKLDEADTQLRRARERWPSDWGAAVEFAWIAFARRDWPEALSRWKYARDRFPDRPEGYLHVAAALNELRRFDDAERVLADGAARFPALAAFPIEQGNLLLRHNRFSEAQVHFQALAARFPHEAAVWLGAARALKAEFKLREADNLLRRAMHALPDEPALALAYFEIPLTPVRGADRDPAESRSRLRTFLERFPDFRPGYVRAARAFCEAGLAEEAEAVSAEAVRRFPDDPAMAALHGDVALARRDWPAAHERFRLALARAPENADAAVGLAAALAGAGRLDDADRTLREATRRFPFHARVFREYAEIAAQRKDWREALARWEDAQRRFPSESHFAERAFATRLRLTEEAGEPERTQPTLASQPRTEKASVDAKASLSISPSELMMQFESLGGTGHGCEFGLVQRHFGAEPLGLLRWADLAERLLIDALRSGLDGVGLPQNTDIFVPDGHDEWWTRDKRYWMAMRTFIKASEASLEQMTRLALKRLGFLRKKLLSDLTEARKIFVYKNMFRNLCEDELRDLHSAVRSFGNATLFYVKYPDDSISAGDVRILAPGLMVGALPNFAFSPQNEPLGLPADDWFRLCVRAHELSERAKFHCFDAFRPA